MMDHILSGLAVTLDGANFLLILLGSFGGIVIGAIPGMTAVMAIALLLPVTYGMNISAALCMLIGVYVGGISGACISAALLRIPGSPSSMATTFDAYPMVRRGEHGKALGLAVFASFLGGLFSALVLTFLAPLLAGVAIRFTPFEYLALVLFTFSCVGSFAGDSIWKPYLAAFLGLTLSMVGTCPMTGAPRMTFGLTDLHAGFSLVPALIGMFALPQLLEEMEEGVTGSRVFARVRAADQLRALRLIFGSFTNFLRSAVIGTGIGILPGVGPGLSNILSYTQAKNASSHPETFGTGEPDGVVASEAANNSSMGGALVPLLTLGIPGDACTLMIMSAFMLHGLQPGPLLFRTDATLMYTVFMAFFLASAATLLFQLSCMNFYTRVLSIKKQYLAPMLLLCCTIGCFAMNNRMFDVWIFFGFGLFGRLLDKLGIPALPIILGFILGPMAEQHLRGGLDISQGSFLPLVTRPIALVFMLASVVFLALPIVRRHRRIRRRRDDGLPAGER